MCVQLKDKIIIKTNCIESVVVDNTGQRIHKWNLKLKLELKI